MNDIVFTCGDINGIGPEITLKCIEKIYSPKKRRIFITCPPNVFRYYYSRINCRFPFEIISVKNVGSVVSSTVSVIGSKNAKMEIGHPSKESGAASFQALETAFELITGKQKAALITAPISKHAWELAGIDFPGHTELLAAWSNSHNFMMMFISGKIKMGLYSIHEPVKKINKLLTATKLRIAIETAHKSMKTDFGIEKPSIALLGLNPHAGENGRIGEEEKNIIKPVIESYADENISGPFPSDAYFGKKLFKQFDFTLGMYHDQILIPFKLMNFDRGVNYTAGLPVIRTSPDHGTAFDIAGKLIANPSSTVNAFRVAEMILKNRERFA